MRLCVECQAPLLSEEGAMCNLCKSEKLRTCPQCKKKTLEVEKNEYGGVSKHCSCGYLDSTMVLYGKPGAFERLQRELGQ